MNGVLVINKPAEFTSFDVVAVVRRLSGQRKIGHTGTLDPNATGVLPLLLGNATRAQDIIPNHDKKYLARFRLGLTTDTLDIWGKVKTRTDAHIERSGIEALIPEFTGEISQLPPMYSAVSVGGKRLYDLARQGLEVERKPRTVKIYSLKLVDFDENSQEGSLSVSCSRGTYIRTLIDDIGLRLGCGAVMTALDRTSACGFTKENALTLDEVKALSESGELESKLMSTESLFEAYPALFVSPAQAKRFSNGAPLDLSRTRLRKNPPEEGAILRVKADGGDFLGLGKVIGGEIKMHKNFSVLSH